MADRIETVAIGASDLRVAPLGVGTWAWGDRVMWGYETDFSPRDVVDAFVASVDAGITLFDTAEVYGHGESEKILGWLVRKSGAKLVVATKYAPLPERRGNRAVRPALDASLRRLGLDSVDLYQVHWADTDVASIASLMDAVASAVHDGKVRAVGVSNFSATEMREAHAALAKHSIPLASNQVHYSLLHRAPEVDGVYDTCRELGVTLMAYSPLEQGLLTGKYGASKLPTGRRAGSHIFAADNMAASARVVARLREIGSGHGGRTAEQVALNWLMAKPGVLPIPGAKTERQAVANAGAMGWQLGADELASIDEATVSWKRVSRG